MHTKVKSIRLRLVVIDAKEGEGMPVCLHGKRIGQLIAEYTPTDPSRRKSDPREVDAEDRRTT